MYKKIKTRMCRFYILFIYGNYLFQSSNQVQAKAIQTSTTTFPTTDEHMTRTSIDNTTAPIFTNLTKTTTKNISRELIPQTHFFTVPELQCTFDNGLCDGFQHNTSADFQWRVHSGNTTSKLTGPETDNSGTATGSYLYTETSDQLNGKIARIQTSILSGAGDMCISFYYHMYGHTMGELSVFVKSAHTGKETLQFKYRQTTKKTVWQKARIPVTMKNFRVIFQSKTSFGIYGDMAIDDIKIKTGGCRFYPKKAYPSATRPTLPPPKTGPSDKSCGQQAEEHVKMHNLLPLGRIIGGKESKIGEWPWMAMIITKIPFGNDNDYESKCGGTLIGVNWIITAAHCLHQIPRKEYIHIRVGVTKAFSGKLNPITDYEAESIYIHHKYQMEGEFNYDFALIKLKQPVKLSSSVQPICLPHKEPQAGQKCFVAGWGQLSNSVDANGDFPSFLQDGSIVITSHNECRKTYPHAITDNMFCAGNDIGKPDTCRHDSGGPLMCENGGKWSLVGITSWGAKQGCGYPLSYGVYGSVHQVQDWIKSVTYRPHKFNPLHYD